MVTEMEQEKTVQVDGEFENFPVCCLYCLLAADGYEIHMGASSRTDFYGK